MQVRKAIIPAAGLGTRFLPATKALPKEMLPIVDKPCIQYIVEEAVASGIETILIITGRHKRAIEDHFDRSLELEATLMEKNQLPLLELVQNISGLADIYYIRQKELKGLGHAVYCARQFIADEPFAVLLGDDIIENDVPCLKQMIKLYEQHQASIIAVQEVPATEVDRYGIVKLAGGGDGGDQGFFRVNDLVEKPKVGEAPSQLAVVGRYILEPEIFAAIEATVPGHDGEIQLTDALRKLVQRQPILAYPFHGKRYDVGDKLGFLQATVEFALKREDLRKEFRQYLSQVLQQGMES